MSSVPQVLGVGTANPPYRYTQREIYEHSTRLVARYRNPRIEQIFMNSDIDARYLSFNFEELDPDESADAMHRRFREYSVSVGRQAIERCLDDAGLALRDIDYVIAVSCTGYLCPGLSALFIREMAMRHDVQRADLVGMGCAGAMPGLQRAYEYVRAYPERRALVVTVEICSACYYVDDSLETVVGNAICGDGAAAVVVGADDRKECPAILGFETLLEPSFLHAVGFQFRSGKLRIVLSKDIRDAAGGLAAETARRILGRNGFQRKDIRHWIVHSGGRKVIDSIKEEVGLNEDQLRHSRCVLRNFGNMSSATVLYVLEETMRHGTPAAGDLGLMLAMGPGLAIEAGLLRW